MKTKNVLPILFLIFAAAALPKKANSQQQTTDLTMLKYTVSEAPEWTALLRRSSGWFGGDGIYTIPLNGRANKPVSAKDKTLFIFSDSMIGEIRDSTLLPGYKMIHNSFAMLSGARPDNNNMKFYWDKDKTGKPESVFIPKTPNTKPGDYFWLGSGFVNQELDKAVYVFGYRIQSYGTGAFDFKEVGNTLIKIPAGHLTDRVGEQQMDTPFYLSGTQDELGSFGAGFYVNTKKAGAPSPDGYIYIYGVRGKKKELLVSRVLPKDFDDYGKWTFWDGKAWNGDISKSAVLTDGVSNELSLSPLPDGRYILVFQVNGIDTHVGMRIGKTPFGPFGPAIKIWDCKKDMVGKNFFVYNAKAHPALSGPGELLISYNVNSFDFFKDIIKYPNLYRPRFIRLKFE